MNNSLGASFRFSGNVNGVPLEGVPQTLKDGCVLIGRHETSDIRLNFPEISGRHAEIRFNATLKQVVIRDLGGQQGTYLNGLKLESARDYPLAVGDKIILGRALCWIETDAAPEEITTPPPISSKRKEISDESVILPNPLIGEIQEALLKRLADVVKQAEDDQQARQAVRQQIGYVIHELMRKGRVQECDVAQLEHDATEDILEYGPIQELLDNPDISEVMVNRPGQIYYEVMVKREKRMCSEMRLCNRAFQNDEHVRQILMRMLKHSARRIDQSSPTVNAILPDGSRLHAVIPPISLSGTTITIRKFHHNLKIGQLVTGGAMTSGIAGFLRLACQERQNIIVSGGTGSGKTTMLNALSFFIPESQRIVTIEDTAELALKQRHVIRLQARPANAEGAGQITIRNLVVEALRMRPDRIVVGECRYGEALDMLQAMNTGHDGSMTTVHANSARDSLNRLETMTLMSGVELPLAAIRQQIVSAVNLIVHVGRLADGYRRVLEVVEVTGLEDGRITTQPVFQFHQDSLESADGGKKITITGHHAPSGHICTFLSRLQQQGKPIPKRIFL
ncbi:TPA: type II secretion system protein E [Candidatus Sumerlaeota bacterium]|nr:type II secretion system protein E [Candidatus Sumerlaeota bacterium]